MTGSATQVLDAPAASDPPAGWAAGPRGEVQAADRAIARQTARRYRALAAFAATSPPPVPGGGLWDTVDDAHVPDPVVAALGVA